MKIAPLLTAATLALALAAGQSAYAAALASDNASNPAYDDGWDNGDNGGGGFGAWSGLDDFGSGGGHFQAVSHGNSNVNVGTDAWGLYANNTENASDAVRTFTSGGLNSSNTLAVGEAFRISFDNGNLQTNSSVGFGLQNSGGTNRFEFYFKGGDSHYFVNVRGTEYKLDGTGGRPTIPFTNSGLALQFNQNASNGFTLIITQLSDNSVFTVYSSNTQDLLASDISQVRVFNYNAGPGDASNVYVNSLAVIPEPGSVSLLAVAAALGLARRRRS